MELVARHDVLLLSRQAADLRARCKYSVVQGHAAEMLTLQRHPVHLVRAEQRRSARLPASHAVVQSSSVPDDPLDATRAQHWVAKSTSVRVTLPASAATCAWQLARAVRAAR